MHAELERVIGSGPLRGRQFTYALLDERVPPSAPLDRDASLAELTRRYFTSHGPATIRDFVWWSGLTVREAKTGVELIASELTRKTVGGREYLQPRALPARAASSRSTYRIRRQVSCSTISCTSGRRTRRSSSRSS